MSLYLTSNPVQHHTAVTHIQLPLTLTQGPARQLYSLVTKPFISWTGQKPPVFTGAMHMKAPAEQFMKLAAGGHTTSVVGSTTSVTGSTVCMASHVLK